MGSQKSVIIDIDMKDLMEVKQFIPRGILGKRSSINKHIWVRMSVTYLGIERRHVEQRGCKM